MEDYRTGRDRKRGETGGGTKGKAADGGGKVIFFGEGSGGVAS